MTAQEGVLSPDDLTDLELWLHNVRTGDTLEEAFVENASSLVGWFVMLIDENKRLNNVLEDLNALDPEQIHICPPEGERCEDLFCSHCWPSWVCQTECSDEGHVWMKMFSNEAIFCERCGQRKPEQNDPSFCWMMAEATDGTDEEHDWVPLGEFRTDEGFLVDGNEYDRLMCRACLVVETHQEAAARAEQFGQEYLDVFGTPVPMDSGPAGMLLHPDDCPHTNWMPFPLSGFSRCLGCGEWNEPEDKCEEAKDGKHAVVPIGIQGIGTVWTCTFCHKDFESKPSSQPTPPIRGSEDGLRRRESGSYRKPTADVEGTEAPVLPPPVEFVSPDPAPSEQEGGELVLFPSYAQRVPGGPPVGDDDGDEVDESAFCYKTCTDPDCPYIHVDVDNPPDYKICGLCGWSDPHDHSDPGVVGSVPAKPFSLTPETASAIVAEDLRAELRAAAHRAADSVWAKDRVAAALARAADRALAPGASPPLALTTGSPVMRMDSCFRCDRKLDLTKNELTICTACAEDDEIAAEVRLAEQDELALLDLFVRLRSETVYLDDPVPPEGEVIDVESVEVDHEDSPFTSEVAWEQAQDQPERVIPPFTTYQAGGWAA